MKNNGTIQKKDKVKKSASVKANVSAGMDFQAIFEAVPGLYLILLPDKNFTIVAVSNAYAQATLTKREEILGRGIFDVFPDNPNDVKADGVSNLRASLNRVVKLKKHDTMAPQKYDIQKPESEGGGWEEKYWEPRNSPVLDNKGEVQFIVHRVVDITELVKMTALEKENARELAESREKLSHIIQNVRDYAIYMLDVNGNVMTWNTGAEKIKGYRADEILGKNISMFYIEEEKKAGKPKRNLELALKNGRHEAEGWHVRRDRSVFWANIIYTPMVDDKGNHYGFTEVARDLTARKRAEEEIKKSNVFLESVLENIPNMVFVKEANSLRFVSFNKAGEELLGYSRKDLLSKNDYDFFPEEQADFFMSKDKAVLAGGDVIDIPEEEIDTKNGKRWLHTRKIPIKDGAGKPVYLLGISEDITENRAVDHEIKKLNRDLSQSVMKLELANRELESFSYSVSHDLRAPLRAIRGYSKILMEDYSTKLEEDAKKIMAGIAGNAERMSQLIDDLLAFSRMGKKEMNMTVVNMNAVVRDSLQDVKASYNNHFQAEVTIHGLPPVSADYSLMLNVFTNLISNAVKYSGKVSSPFIEIDAYQKNGENIYFVKDNGVGFDMKYYDKLFGVFQRLHSTAEFEGTGVGLALVKRIVTRHGGRVWAESEPGRGAAFYIALPVNN